jgi:hypothetical protein
MSEESYSQSVDGSYSGEYSGEDMGEQQQQQQQRVAQGERPEYKIEQLQKEAKVNFTEVTYVGCVTFKPKQFFDSKGQLKKEAKLVFKQGLGKDATLELTSLKGKKSNFETVSSQQGKKPGERAHYKNIVSQLVVDRLETNFTDSFVLAFPTVPAMDEEFFYGDKKHVSHHFMIGDAQLIREKPCEILSRPTTNWQLHFHNRFPGKGPDTFMDEFLTDTANNYTVMSTGNPLLLVANDGERKLKQKEYNAKTCTVFGNNQIQVPQKIVETYMPATKKMMTEKISYGDLLSVDFYVEAYVPCPAVLQEMHNKAVKTRGREGAFHHGFGDFNHTLQIGAQKLTKDEWMEKEFYMQIRIKGKALSLKPHIKYDIHV